LRSHYWFARIERDSEKAPTTGHFSPSRRFNYARSNMIAINQSPFLSGVAALSALGVSDFSPVDLPSEVEVDAGFAGGVASPQPLMHTPSANIQRLAFMAPSHFEIQLPVNNSTSPIQYRIVRQYFHRIFFG
jgi:hypothetical protein